MHRLQNARCFPTPLPKRQPLAGRSHCDRDRPSSLPAITKLYTSHARAAVETQTRPLRPAHCVHWSQRAFVYACPLGRYALRALTKARETHHAHRRHRTAQSSAGATVRARRYRFTARSVKPHCSKSQLHQLQLQYRALAAALHHQPVTRHSNWKHDDHAIARRARRRSTNAPPTSPTPLSTG